LIARIISTVDLSEHLLLKDPFLAMKWAF